MCTRNSEMIINGNVLTIKPTDVPIKDLKAIDWPVGGLKRQTVHKGFSFRVYFPVLSKKDMRELVQNRSVDSWLIKIEKQSGRGSEILGRYFVPLTFPGRSTKSDFRIKQLAFGVVKIFYAAAAISSRLAQIRCPVLNHASLLKSMSIVEHHEVFGNKEIVLSVSYEKKIPQKVLKFNYTPPVMNAGNNLRGDYYVKLALYNSSTNKRLSNYYSLKQKIKVDLENSIVIKGCANFTLPVNPLNGGEAREKFKFGR